MSAPTAMLGAALLAALDDETIRALAERLRPYLEDRPHHRPLLTPAQAAKRLSLHPKTVVRLARDGRLPAVKVGTGWRFDPDRLVVTPRARTQTALAGRSRAGAHPVGVPASVRAIRGENAASGRGPR